MKAMKLILGLAISLCLLNSQEPPAKPKVSISTSYGAVIVELEPEIAPITVENFLNYVRTGYYNETIFHRVIDGFMIQGGGMNVDLEEKDTNPPIKNESKADGMKNLRGTIAMARTEAPNSATSQFYINLADNSKLDFSSSMSSGIGYCVFGKVISGMEVVDRIGKVRTVRRRGHSDVPEFAVKIIKIELLSEDQGEKIL